MTTNSFLLRYALSHAAVLLLTLSLPSTRLQAQRERPAIPLRPHPVHAGAHPGAQSEAHPEGGPSITATETVLYSFCAASGCADGSYPYGSLTPAADGNFYGTAPDGGPGAAGVIFKMAADGTYSVVHNFCQISGCPDGKDPNNTLIQDEHGNLWGTTYEGGTNTYGTVFKLAPDGTYTKVYDFCALALCADGSRPNGNSLVEGSDGNFYGMTVAGGTGGGGTGTIFKVTPTGTYTTLYSFCSLTNCADGEYPAGDLVQGSDGKLYGWTYEGGTGSGSGGTLFSIATDGTGFTVLYSFCSVADCADGGYPYYGSLTEAADGNYYGMTYEGGSTYSGEIFSVSPAGTYTALHSLCTQTNCADGGYPYNGKLNLGSDGNFYGAPSYGGTASEGVFIQVTTSGTVTPLYEFCAQTDCADGEDAIGSWVQMEDGYFYGTLYEGGANGAGAITSLSLVPSMPGPLQMSFEQPQIKVGQSDTFDWVSSNSFSTTMQQCNAFAKNLNTGVLYPLGPVTGTLSNSGTYRGTFTTPGAPASGYYLVSLTCGGTETVYTTVYVAPPVVTTLLVTPSISPLVSGQQESFTVNVSAADSTVVNSGNVTIACNGATFGPVAVTAGTAIISASSARAPSGEYACTARYADSGTTYATSSASVQVPLTNQTSTVAVSSSQTTYVAGATVTVTATVSGQYVTPFNGYVHFTVNGHSLGYVNTSGGAASLTVPADAAAGTYTVRADYLGTAGTSPSTGTLDLTITP